VLLSSSRAEDRGSSGPQGVDVAAVAVIGEHLLDELLARRADPGSFVEVDDVLPTAGDELGQVVVGRARRPWPRRRSAGPGLDLADAV
jgi:hypothetical protein